MQLGISGSHSVKSISCCLLFDPDDGKIHHTHRIVTMDGADETSTADLEAQTLKIASDLGLDTERLQVLHVEDEELSEPARYSVDPATRTLVKEQRFSLTGLPHASS